MKTQRNIGGLVILLVALIAFGTSGCKSAKKGREAAAAKARMEQAAAEKARQDELARQQAEEKRLNADKANRELEEQARRNAASKSDTPTSQKLEQYFTSIAGSSSTTAANSSIQEALTMFASEDTPVLIVISEEGGQKDYDKPTTIKAYLNYLKDQRKKPDHISNVQMNDAGRIKELELLKENG